ncbi:MAG: hypothetical protein K8R53_06875 [Bacteroidales bacterium]|nr:hypothetical protein [Bacteroidales bacterium]
MKNFIKILALITISLGIIFTSCSKDEAASDDDPFKSAAYEEADLILEGDGDYEKVITKPLVKIEGCYYIVEGTIEFRKDGEVIAIIDFGEGECDDIATKIVDGKTFEFSMKKEGKKEKYEKKIVEPIVKIEGCDYIVSGVIEFYAGEKWVATIDFGDGECDEWATKITEEGSFEFSMKDWGKKGKP